MSKISEQKALEAYPMDEYEFDKAKKSNIERSRYAYIKGYDQAMQDFLEKACEWLEDTQLENFICRDDGVYFDNEKLIEQFKTKMR